jgi:hypothetical protein
MISTWGGPEAKRDLGSGNSVQLFRRNAQHEGSHEQTCGSILIVPATQVALAGAGVESELYAGMSDARFSHLRTRVRITKSTVSFEVTLLEIKENSLHPK